MSENNEAFDWSPLGEAWWRQAVADLPIAVSEKQVRFAAAKHRGCSDVESARQADYAGTKETMKQSAYKAARSNAVVQLIALAKLDSPGTTKSKLVDDLEVQEILSKQIRSGDSNTAIRATELYNKIKERAAVRGQTEDGDGFSDWRMVRDYLNFPGGAPAVVHLLTSRSQSLSALPLLHDVHAACMQEDPDLWARKVLSESPAMQAHLQRLLDNPGWQRAARVKIWKEIGITANTRLGGHDYWENDPSSEGEQQAVVIPFNGDMVGHEDAGDSAWVEEQDIAS